MDFARPATRTTVTPIAGTAITLADVDRGEARRYLDEEGLEERWRDLERAL